MRMENSLIDFVTNRQNREQEVRRTPARPELRARISRGRQTTKKSRPHAYVAGPVPFRRITPRREESCLLHYCISDITSCDMLPLCLSIEVLACISICLEVMLEV